MQSELEHSLQILKSGGTLVYPTDTVWGLGCDATSKKAVAKIFVIKRRQEDKSLIVLVDNFAMLQRYVPAIPSAILDILIKLTTPITVVYNNPMGLAQNLVASDNTVAIRIVKDGFCHELIKKYNKPIVSTSANISGVAAPRSFKEIDTSLLDAVDYVVNLQQNKPTNVPSTIVKINEKGQLVVIRD
ncbi:MAG: threonylcarbamoyl-AMP synthase [Flavobacteriaceae bacterium]|nr:threonylcarbamoyl-AMP synthase [Flavobacteriaceae bacterium]